MLLMSNHLAAGPLAELERIVLLAMLNENDLAWSCRHSASSRNEDAPRDKEADLIVLGRMVVAAWS